MFAYVTTEAGRRSILAVDDERDELRCLSDLLRRQRYQVRTAADGEAGYQSALAEPPDLILLDVRMAGLDGLAACRLLKADPATRAIPVIFVSAVDHPEERVAALTAGGVDYIVKPYHPAELLARVRVHLELAGMRRAAAPAAAPHHPDHVLTAAAMRMIDHNLAEPLTLAGIARALGTHEKRLSHSFREYAGTTVFSYLGEARIAHGRRLLAATDLSVQQVAEQSGFRSAANFATAFREQVGATPTAFRQNARQDAGAGVPA